MKSGRIGFVSIAHNDYINEIVTVQTQLAKANIEKAGYEVLGYDGLVVDYKTAEEAGKFLAASTLDGVVIFLASWMECPSFMSVLREVEHLPICVQAFPMCMFEGRQESTGAYVAYAMIKGTLDRLNHRYTGILQDVDCDDTRAKISCFCSAAVTASRLKRSRIGLVGYTSMSIYPGTFDHVLMRAKIGPEIEHYDSYTLINLAEKAALYDRDIVIEKYRASAKIHPETSLEMLRKSAGIYLAMKEIVAEKELSAINIKCQYEFSKEYKMVPCVPLSLIADNGVVASCEGDMLNTVSMLILNYLSGKTVTYGDAMNHTDNTIKLSSCGFNPFSMGVEDETLIRNFMPHPGFTGIQSSFVIRPGRVTVMRLIEDIGDYHILYFTGEGLKTDLRQGYMPALDVKLDGNIEDLVDNFSGQHYAICFGDYSNEIESLAAILGVKAIRV